MTTLIKDRGTIKWTAMMLPEHVHKLRKIWENDKRVPERIVDEQQLELINTTIQRAITDHLAVNITYFENGGYIQTLGYVEKIDPYTSIVSILTPQSKKINIDTNRILDVEQME